MNIAYFITRDEDLASVFEPVLKKIGWVPKLVKPGTSALSKNLAEKGLLFLDEKETSWFSSQEIKDLPVYILADEPEKIAESDPVKNIKGILYKTEYSAEELGQVIGGVKEEEQEKPKEKVADFKIVKNNESPNVKQKTFILTPKFLISLIAGLIFVLVIGFLIFRQALNALKPASNNQTVQQDQSKAIAASDFDKLSVALGKYKSENQVYPTTEGKTQELKNQLDVLVEKQYLQKIPYPTYGKYYYESDGTNYKLTADTTGGTYLVSSP